MSGVYAIAYYQKELISSYDEDVNVEPSKFNVVDNCTLEQCVADLSALFFSVEKRKIDHPLLFRNEWQYVILINGKAATKDQAWSIEEKALEICDINIFQYRLETNETFRIEEEKRQAKLKELRRKQFIELQKEFGGTVL